MPACPFGNHRLNLDSKSCCRICGNSVPVFAELCRIPISFFNTARSLFDEDQLNEAAVWLAAALRLDDSFAEAWWLLGAVQMRLDESDAARNSLSRAVAAGAPLDIREFLDAAP